MTHTTLTRPQRILYLGLLANFAVFGATFTVVGALIPQVIRSFSWNYTTTAVVLAASYVSGMAVAPAIGRLSGLSRLTGPRALLIAGLALTATAFMLFARSSSPLANALVMLLLGIGNGCNEVVTNLEVVTLDRAGAGRLMNLMHASFCIGAVLAPLAISGVPALTAKWRTVFPAAAVPVGLMALLVALLPFAAPGPADSQAPAGAPRAGKGSPLSILLLALAFVYCGAELSIASWVSEYFVKVLDAPVQVGARALSMLWLGILLGRLVNASGARGLSHERQLLVMAVGSVIFLLAALLARGVVPAAVFVLLTGLSYAGFYPMIVTIMGDRVRSGTAIGLVSASGTLGALLFPFAMAALSDRFGMRGGFLLCCGANAVLVGLAAALMGVVREPPGPATR